MYIFHVMIFCICEIDPCHTLDAIIIYRLNLGIFTNHWTIHTFQNYYIVIYMLEKCPMKGQTHCQKAFCIHLYFTALCSLFKDFICIQLFHILYFFSARFVKFLFIVIYLLSPLSHHVNMTHFNLYIAF